MRQFIVLLTSADRAVGRHELWRAGELVSLELRQLGGYQLSRLPCAYFRTSGVRVCVNCDAPCALLGDVRMRQFIVLLNFLS